MNRRHFFLASLAGLLAPPRASDAQPGTGAETVLGPALKSKIVLTPRVTPSGRFYEFAGELSYGALVTGLIGTGDGRVLTVVPPG
jgi:hypothetical protein